MDHNSTDIRDVIDFFTYLSNVIMAYFAGLTNDTPTKRGIHLIRKAIEANLQWLNHISSSERKETRDFKFKCFMYANSKLIYFNGSNSGTNKLKAELLKPMRPEILFVLLKAIFRECLKISRESNDKNYALAVDPPSKISAVARRLKSFSQRLEKILIKLNYSFIKLDSHMEANLVCGNDLKGPFKIVPLFFMPKGLIESLTDSNECPS